MVRQLWRTNIHHLDTTTPFAEVIAWLAVNTTTSSEERA